MTANAMQSLAIDIMAESLRQGATALGNDNDSKPVKERCRLAYKTLTGLEPEVLRREPIEFEESK